MEQIAKNTLEWMKKNNRMAYKLADAYKLMKYEETLRAAENKGAKSLADHAKRGTGVLSIAASGDEGASKDPYAAYIAMSEDDLASKISVMPDAKFEEFLKKATPAFKQKFPTLPYPD